MTIQTVQQYKTSDGKVHATKDKAEAHELALTMGKKVDDFLKTLKDDDGKPLPQRALTMRRNAILAWEQWKARQRPPLSAA